MDPNSEAPTVPPPLPLRIETLRDESSANTNFPNSSLSLPSVASFSSSIKTTNSNSSRVSTALQRISRARGILGTISTALESLQHNVHVSKRIIERASKALEVLDNWNSALIAIATEKKLHSDNESDAVDEIALPSQLAAQTEAILSLLVSIEQFIQQHTKRQAMIRIINRQSIDAKLHSLRDRLVGICNEIQSLLLLKLDEQGGSVFCAPGSLDAVDTSKWASDDTVDHEDDIADMEDRLQEIMDDDYRIIQYLGLKESEYLEALEAFQNLLQRSSESTIERLFVERALQCLQRAYTGTNKPEINNWTITSWEVEIGDPIARGGFGEVLKGIWLGHSEVAVKRLYMKLDTRRLKDDFMREVKAWYPLRHPHVLELLGACSSARQPFMISPFMHSGHALQYLEQFQPPSTWRNIKLLYEVSQGMSYLHNRRVVHGDLKALNILVDKYGKAVVSDFGFAVLKRVTTTRTAESTGVAGTLRWMSPERLQGGKLTNAVDVYAFGMMAFEVLSGGDVPLSDIPDALVYQSIVLNDARPERPDIESDNVCNDALWSLITMCWQKAAERRPSFDYIANTLQSMVETAAIFERYNSPQDKVRMSARFSTRSYVFSDISSRTALSKKVEKKTEEPESDVDPEVAIREERQQELLDAVQKLLAEVVANREETSSENKEITHPGPSANQLNEELPKDPLTYADKKITVKMDLPVSSPERKGSRNTDSPSVEETLVQGENVEVLELKTTTSLSSASDKSRTSKSQLSKSSTIENNQYKDSGSMSSSASTPKTINTPSILLSPIDGEEDNSFIPQRLPPQVPAKPRHLSINTDQQGIISTVQQSPLPIDSEPKSANENKPGIFRAIVNNLTNRVVASVQVNTVAGMDESEALVRNMLLPPSKSSSSSAPKQIENGTPTQPEPENRSDEDWEVLTPDGGQSLNGVSELAFERFRNLMAKNQSSSNNFEELRTQWNSFQNNFKTTDNSHNLQVAENIARMWAQAIRHSDPNSASFMESFAQGLGQLRKLQNHRKERPDWGHIYQYQVNQMRQLWFDGLAEDTEDSARSQSLLKHYPEANMFWSMNWGEFASEVPIDDFMEKLEFWVMLPIPKDTLKQVLDPQRTGVVKSYMFVSFIAGSSLHDACAQLLPPSTDTLPPPTTPVRSRSTDSSRSNNWNLPVPSLPPAYRTVEDIPVPPPTNQWNQRPPNRPVPQMPWPRPQFPPPFPHRAPARWMLHRPQMPSPMEVSRQFVYNPGPTTSTSSQQVYAGNTHEILSGIVFAGFWDRNFRNSKKVYFNKILKKLQEEHPRINYEDKAYWIERIMGPKYAGKSASEIVVQLSEFIARLPLPQKDMQVMWVDIVEELITEKAWYIDRTLDPSMVNVHIFDGSWTHQHLSFRGSSQGDKSMRIIANELKRNLTLRSLNLSNMSIRSGIVPLVEALRVNNSLFEIDLCDNHVDDLGLRMLDHVLSNHNFTIREIKLERNDIKLQSEDIVCFERLKWKRKHFDGRYVVDERNRRFNLTLPKASDCDTNGLLSAFGNLISFFDDQNLNKQLTEVRTQLEACRFKQLEIRGQIESVRQFQRGFQKHTQQLYDKLKTNKDLLNAMDMDGHWANGDINLKQQITLQQAMIDVKLRELARQQEELDEMEAKKMKEAEDLSQTLANLEKKEEDLKATMTSARLTRSGSTSSHQASNSTSTNP
ncbi:hypothetical protein HK098_000069 [Nowakowskiella sp. JEL0407]|nr:hypothetical protein HK098_000069 [Nowakowskiella sp. JEL0407]